MTDVSQGFSASELMSVWERGAGLDDVGRAVLLLICGTGMPANDAAKVDVAKRDRQILDLRAATFGTRLETFFSCDRCGELLEFMLDTNDLRSAGGEEKQTCVKQGLTMRLPDSTDLRAASAAGSVDEARKIIFHRCVTCSSPESEVEGLATFSDWLAAMAPEIESMLEIDCPACGLHRSVAFDIVPFFWREIESACSSLAREVDALARMYGWHESEILAMTPARRALYLRAVTE